MSVPMTRAELERVVHAATLAPSVLNVQPWRFVAQGGALELHRDRGRILRAVDPVNRALTISCGAALYNARLAMLGLGRRPVVELLPDGPRSALLARVRPGEPSAASAAEHRLLAAIPVRRSSRVPFSDEAPPPALLHKLEDAAATESTTFRLLDRHTAWDMARVVREADLAQRADVELRAEVSRWTRRDTTAPDGIPENALGPTPLDSATLVRDFAMGLPIPGRAVAEFETKPNLAIMLTHDDDAESWLAAGQALEAVWLELTADGWDMSLLTQPLEVSILRWLSRPLTASAPRDPLPTGGSPGAAAGRPFWPQALLRIGKGVGWTPPTPRRPLADVLSFA